MSKMEESLKESSHEFEEICVESSWVGLSKPYYRAPFSIFKDASSF